MAICYDKLWKILADKKMNRTELKEASGISYIILYRAVQDNGYILSGIVLWRIQNKLFHSFTRYKPTLYFLFMMFQRLFIIFQ